MLSKPVNEQTPLDMRLDSQLCFALYSATNTVEQMYRPLLERYDLTYTQYIVLMSLSEEDGISITTLAERIGVANATMTPLLKRLEAKGLLTREVRGDNERQKSVVITPSGRALFKEAFRVTEQVFCGTGLTVKQASELIRLCKLITKR